MGTILSFLGLVFIFLIVKFIYDTYLTSNTEEKFKEFRKTNPLEAAEIDPPSNEKDFNNLVNTLSDNYDDIKTSIDVLSQNGEERTLGVEISKIKFIEDYSPVNGEIYAKMKVGSISKMIPVLNREGE